jgi:hypothetical protein
VAFQVTQISVDVLPWTPTGTAQLVPARAYGRHTSIFPKRYSTTWRSRKDLGGHQGEVPGQLFCKVFTRRGDCKEVEREVQSLLEQSKHSIQELDRIALRPNAMSMTEYLILLIRSERLQRKPGFDQRIRQYESLKVKYEQLNKVAHSSRTGAASSPAPVQGGALSSIIDSFRGGPTK